MSSVPAQPKKKLPIGKLAVVGLVVAAGAVLLLRGVDLRALATLFMEAIRAVGPVAFFAGMAILPAFGAPMTAFTIPAGEAFAPSLGMPAVIAISLVMVAINMALAYWMSRYALRPLLTWLVTRYGYEVPRVTPENALSILLVVRLTPGPPYALQCFVLGIAEVPFRLYMIVSWLALLPWAVGAIILGQGLFNGKIGTVMIGIMVLVVASIGFQWLRKKYFARES